MRIKRRQAKSGPSHRRQLHNFCQPGERACQPSQGTQEVQAQVEAQAQKIQGKRLKPTGPWKESPERRILREHKQARLLQILRRKSVQRFQETGEKPRDGWESLWKFTHSEATILAALEQIGDKGLLRRHIISTKLFPKFPQKPNAREIAQALKNLERWGLIYTAFRGPERWFTSDCGPGTLRLIFPIPGRGEGQE